MTDHRDFEKVREIISELADRHPAPRADVEALIEAAERFRGLHTDLRMIGHAKVVPYPTVKALVDAAARVKESTDG